MRLRPLSVTAGLALAAASLVALPAPAQAAAITSATNTASRQINEVGPATCTVNNASSNSSGPFTSNGVPVTHSVSGTTTLVDTGDASDTSSVASTATSKARATEAGGSMKTVDIDATFTAGLTIAQGAATDCDAEVQLGAQTQVTGVLTQPKWVVIDAEVPSGGTTQVLFQRTTPVTPAVFEVVALLGNSKGRAHAELFLPAGTYQNTAVTVVTWDGPQVAGDPTSFSATPFVHVAYETVGSAKDSAVGSGTEFAKFKDTRDCAGGKLKGKFLKAAGTKDKRALKKAIFKIDGKKAKVVKKAAKGGKITLKGLPSDQDIELTATFKLVGGGSETFSREYFSCT